jgi:hypothetical protein
VKVAKKNLNDLLGYITFLDKLSQEIGRC